MKYYRAKIGYENVRGIWTVYNGCEFYLQKNPMRNGDKPANMWGYPFSWRRDPAVDDVRMTFRDTDKHRILSDRLIMMRRIKYASPFLHELFKAKIDDCASMSQDDEGKVSYANDIRFKYNSEKRVKTSFQRYVRRRLGVKLDQLTDQELDEITWVVMGCAKPATFRIVDGDDILEAYRESYGACSCMTDNSRETTNRILYVYKHNPDKVKMLLMDGDQKARALLWTCDDGTRVLDRIYPGEGEHVGQYYDWCEKNGVVHRSHNSYPSGNIKLSDGKFHEVTLKHNGHMPYMDTWHYGEQDGDLVVCTNECDKYGCEFDSTGGGGLEELSRCESCGNRYNRDDMETFNNELYCEGCIGEVSFVCERCEEREGLDNQVRVGDQYWCERCADNHSFVCDDCGGRFNDDEHNSTGDGGDVCDGCFSDYTACDECGEYFKDIRGNDGNYYCETCGAECAECGKWFVKADLSDGVCEACASEDDSEDGKPDQPEATGETVQADGGAGDAGGGGTH